MKEKCSASYAMLVSSMLIFGTIGIFRRYIPLPSALLACARGIMGSLFLIVFVKLKGRNIRHGIGMKKFWLLALSGAIMGANWMFLFEAYNHTTVAIATLCYYMQPTIVILLSPIVFREKLTGKKIICVIISLIGMIFVSGIMSGTTGEQTDFSGIIFGLTAAALYAAVVILNKKVQIEDAYEKTIIQLASAAAIMVPYLAITGVSAGSGFSGLTIVMLFVVGIVHTGVAYALYFGSMGALKAQSIAVLSYIDPVSALILSALFLGESMSVWGMIGAVMIIGAALVSEIGD